MTDELIGKTIGGYEILELIGRGGMATVYRAQQVSMKRVVAVKVLPRQYIHDDTYLQRFNQEVKIVSQLEHRNIVPVYDYGEVEGQPYIVMRYMAAGSVDDLLKHGPLEIETIISIMEQIAPALDYAHTKNVLHRDLKPSNVLRDDDGGAYLTDFGIARILGEQGVSITTQGVVGTPSYMSPEQAQGQALDSRSDIYALGVMLFEMATGRRPFESDTPYSIAVMQVTTSPPSPRVYNQNLSFALEEVILRTLKKKREDRYPHAVALTEALKRAVNMPSASVHDTQPVAVRTPPPVPIEPMRQASPPPVMSVPQIRYNTPPPSQPMPSGASVSQVRRRKPRRFNNAWMNAAVGGVVGCGVLVVLTITILLLVSLFANNSGTGNTATPQPTSRVDDLGIGSFIPTLDPTSQAARNAVVPEPTATIVTRPTPVSTATMVPVGVRTNVALDPLVQAIGGSLVYFAERNDSIDLFYLNLSSGQETQLTFGNGVDAFPAVSPDGQQIAFQSDRDGDFDIFVMNLNGENLRQLTHNAVDDRLPAWSPDGAWISFTTDTQGDGSFDLYRSRPDGGETQPILNDQARNSGPHWSPAGDALIFTTGGTENGATWEIGRLELSSDRVMRLTENSVKDWSPIFSPDGNKILFLTAQAAEGDSAIALMAADGSDRQTLFDSPGYEWGAAYSPDGRYITFTVQNNDREQIYVIPAAGGEALQVTSSGGAYASWVPS